MKQNETNQILNRLSELLQLINTQEYETFVLPLSDYSNQSRSIYNGDNKIVLRGQDAFNRVESIVELFWDCDREIRQTLSRQVVEEKIIELIFHCQNTRTQPTINTLDQISRELRQLQKQEYLAVRFIHGASLDQSLVKLGPFTIYKWDAYQSALASTNLPFLDSCLQNARELQKNNISSPSKFPLLENCGNIFISVEVAARDKQRAIELADDRFHQFEDVISYMLGHEARRFSFGVVDSSNINSLEYLLITTGGIYHDTGSLHNPEPVELDSLFFMNDKLKSSGADEVQFWVNSGHTWIWETLKLEPLKLSKWQGRILSAIEWIGKGLRDKNSARSLVQFTFALEALFFYQEKGILASPSIVSTLADFSAFIGADNFKDREFIIKTVNEIYGERSSVAHGGTQDVQSHTVSLALKLLKNLITRIITNSELSSFQSIEQLQNWIKERKYS